VHESTGTGSAKEFDALTDLVVFGPYNDRKNVNAEVGNVLTRSGIGIF
jgi:hypothetical protein